ncbi:hypothetical protein ACFOLC_03010 [Lysobacter cavernae]|uniref:Uncharacterized protein n=1 Tax=Lysobacter cavernae TaxID=1685901 RepID=A0ABV7RLG1_9GAMM
MQKFNCLAARHGDETAARFDPGVVLIAVAGGVLAWWFVGASARRQLRKHPDKAFAQMLLTGLLAFLPAALLIEGLSDGSLLLATRRTPVVLFDCAAGKFWMFAGIYYFSAVAMISHAVASWSFWRGSARS